MIYIVYIYTHRNTHSQMGQMLQNHAQVFWRMVYVLFAVLLVFGRFQWLMIIVVASMLTIEAKEIEVEVENPTSFEDGKWFWTGAALVVGLAVFGLFNLGYYTVKIIKAVKIIIREGWYGHLEQAATVPVVETQTTTSVMAAADVVQGDELGHADDEVQADGRSLRFIGITEANLVTARQGGRSTWHKKMHSKKNCSQLASAVGYIEIDISRDRDGECRTCRRA